MRIHPRLVIAGTHSGVGKTTVTLALLSAFARRGRRVQAFKAGPDFIDPGHHSLATGRLSRNLDGWMLGADLNRSIFTRAAASADVSIIEGMMGLFDGSSPVDERGSTAELAKQLQAPVLLVIDASAMARSAAALVSGYAKFDPALKVAGVVFNRVGSEAHYRLLKDAVEKETDVTVVGYLRADTCIVVSDRHLGLVTAIEQQSSELYDRLAHVAMDTIDLDRIELLAGSAPSLAPRSEDPMTVTTAEKNVRVGVAYDPAFCFYYPENLELLEAGGAEVVKFSPMNDQWLPDVDMLYLGGGYPELYADKLAANIMMRRAVRSFAEQGGVVYAECGGMMYLTESIRDFDGRSHDMVGLFPAETVMRKTSMTLGYRTLTCSRPCMIGEEGLTARGHEFHYSTLVSKGSLNYACEIHDAQGQLVGQDGLVAHNVLALYTHVHFYSTPKIAKDLLAIARRVTPRSHGEPRILQ